MYIQWWNRNSDIHINNTTYNITLIIVVLETKGRKRNGNIIHYQSSGRQGTNRAPHLQLYIRTYTCPQTSTPWLNHRSAIEGTIYTGTKSIRIALKIKVMLKEKCTSSSTLRLEKQCLKLANCKLLDIHISHCIIIKRGWVISLQSLGAMNGCESGYRLNKINKTIHVFHK